MNCEERDSLVVRVAHKYFLAAITVTGKPKNEKLEGIVDDENLVELFLSVQQNAE